MTVIDSRNQMERATKLLVVAWVLVALMLKAWLLRGDWPNLPVYVAVLTIASAALVAFDPRAVAAVLVFTCIYPALIYVGRGRYHVDLTEIWLGPLIGAMLPDALRSSWHIPLRWRRPLVIWACVVVVAVPLVILRESDFLPEFFVINSAPRFAARWELFVGEATLAGILWFDWLFSERRPDFTRWIAAPLAASAAIMSSVALYQGLVNISFLNETPYGAVGRASGTLFDANITGTIAALWIGGVTLLALQLKALRAPAAIVGIAVMWGAVWMTGSRTAFTAATLVTVFLATAPWWRRSSREPGRSTALWKMAGLAAILVLVILTLSIVGSESVGPVRRLWNTLPALNSSSLRAFFFEMWNRNGYGSAGASMIRQYPLFGVGFGSFYSLATSFGVGYNLMPDNAQNWYRHLFAELGLVGSLGWIEWTALFGLFLFKRQPGASPSRWVVRGMLLALGAISFVGVPGQAVPVIITFWTLAYWYVLNAGVPESTGSLGSRQLGFIAAVVVIFGAGTLATGLNSLRPPVRAQHFGQPYVYGFYEAEPTPDGGVQQWARRVAAQTIEVKSAWMELSAGVNHFDVREHPVDAQVWIDGRPVIDAHLTSTEMKTVYVGIRPPEQWALMRTRVNRAIRPRDLGVPDDRELGLIVQWRFVSAPPPGADVR